MSTRKPRNTQNTAAKSATPADVESKEQGGIGTTSTLEGTGNGPDPAADGSADTTGGDPATNDRTHLPENIGDDGSRTIDPDTADTDDIVWPDAPAGYVVEPGQKLKTTWFAKHPDNDNLLVTRKAIFRRVIVAGTKRPTYVTIHGEGTVITKDEAKQSV